MKLLLAAAGIATALLVAAPAVAAPAPAEPKWCSVQCSGRQSISYQDWLNCMQQCYQAGGS
jgi:hypothetical protein